MGGSRGGNGGQGLIGEGVEGADLLSQLMPCLTSSEEQGEEQSREENTMGREVW